MSSDLMQPAYTATLKYVIATGRAPHYTELAEILQVSVEDARLAQVAAAERAVGCWMAEGNIHLGAGSSPAKRSKSTPAVSTAANRSLSGSGTRRLSRYRRARWSLTSSIRSIGGGIYRSRTTENV